MKFLRRRRDLYLNLFARARGLLLPAILVLPAGCAHQLEPVSPPVSQPAAEEFSMRPYLQANRLGRWTYVRLEPDRDDHEATPYTRLAGPDRMVEGKLVGRDFLPLKEYLVRTSAASRPADDHRPKAPLKGGAAFMFELLEPMDPFPPDLVPGLPIIDTTPIQYYEYNGRLLSEGTLTRRVEIEGIEDAECPARLFRNCLRVRVDLIVHLPWMLKMNWTSFIWLSPEMGEVRRIEQMYGWFLIFWFASTHEYQLVTGESYRSSLDTALLPPPLWKYGAVVMNRTVPRPEIGGMLVDYATGPPATAPAGGLTRRPGDPATR